MRSDVVIASYNAVMMRSLECRTKILSAINKKIIYGRITGYGPLNDRVGYDACVTSGVGLMSLNGEKDGPPIKMPVALIDVLSCASMKEGC
ncbi:MAG: CoA transferase [Bacteroidota bacterium]